MRSGHYARLTAAMQAHLDGWQGPDPFYFDRELVATPVTSELYAEAEAICGGARRVLGLGWIDLPAQGWHYEPNAKADWPRLDAARVVRAAPGHFDPRLTWELNRGHEWVVLARVYASTREPRFFVRLLDELASWRAANPLGLGINWSSAMEAAIRIHSLVWCAGFLRGAREVLPVLARMIYEHARFVADHRSYYSSANNHLIVESSGLIVAGLALGGELAELHATALARLIAELDLQIFPDGVNAEMATHYHVFVLEALLLVAYLQRAHAAPSRPLEAVILRMADYLCAIRCADGSLLQQGDNDDGRILPFFHVGHADQLVAATAGLRATSRRRTATPAPEHEGVFWLAGGRQAEAIEDAPVRSRRFSASGQVVLRSPRTLVTFDAGPFGFGALAAHAHCDALSILVAVDGRRLLVDRGTYRYNGDRRERDRYRLTAAHNTVQIGSLEQASPAGAFLWSRRPTSTLHRCELSPDGDVVQASHDGFPGWLHRRTLLHHGGVLVVVDELEGANARGPIVSRLHLAPELDLTAISSGRFRAAHGASPVAWLATNATSARIVVTPHSDLYATRTSAPSLELSFDAGAALVTAIAPVDVPPQEAIDRIAALAEDRGIAVPARELAAS